MGTVESGGLYRHAGVALLRAARWPATTASEEWPGPDDAQGCVRWLRSVWSGPGFAEAVRQASPTLADRVEAVCTGRVVEAKRVRRAVVATAGYLLRARGRPTPFGLFAGVAPVTVTTGAAVRWGTGHRPVVRVDTQWLSEVVDRLEALPALLERVDVVVSDLVVRRGGRLEAPCGLGRVRVRYTAAVRAVWDAAAVPVRFGAVADGLADAFAAPRWTVVGMLAELVRQGFLVSCLRAPMTVTDPLAYVLDRLAAVDADAVPPARRLLEDLRAVQDEVGRLTAGTVGGDGPAVTWQAVTGRMRRICAAARVPLAVDLRLDCQVRLPERVAEQAARAASALLRLTRHPAGWPAWRDYHAAFVDRYGTGTLVAVTEVVDPDAGLGFPAGYPGSLLPAPVDAATGRDGRLLALAWQVVTAGGHEIALTDETIDAVAGHDGRPDPRWVPPHVELAVRVHAADAAAVDRGDYLMVVAPARAGGTLTSRFTPTTTGCGLQRVYGQLPAGTGGALPVQLSFPPLYPHAQNVSRVPAYLPDVLPLGEHRPATDGQATVRLDDLALTATPDRLHLVSISRRRVVEPQVVHALADKQAPPLARFLTQLPRAYLPSWTVLGWGPAGEQLPYLPWVRYGRCLLAPARWRVTADQLPAAGAALAVWYEALHRWRRRLACPGKVELRDDDRSLPLELHQPLHAAILRAHLARHGHAVLTGICPDGHRWTDDHAHEIALPLVRAAPPAPAPALRPCPVLTNGRCGQWPGEPGSGWLSAHVHAHPDRHDEIIAHRLPELHAALGDHGGCWVVHYRSPRHSDQLRPRVPTAGGDRYAACLAAVGRWAARLRRDRLATGLVIDVYRPEVGRYGPAAALHAAEQVFVADTAAVSAQLRHLPPRAVDPVALTTAGMTHIVCAFLGPDHGMTWLATTASPPAVPARTARSPPRRSGWPNPAPSTLLRSARPAGRVRSPWRGAPARRRWPPTAASWSTPPAAWTPTGCWSRCCTCTTTGPWASTRPGNGCAAGWRTRPAWPGRPAPGRGPAGETTTTAAVARLGAAAVHRRRRPGPGPRRVRPHRRRILAAGARVGHRHGPPAGHRPPRHVRAGLRRTSGRLRPARRRPSRLRTRPRRAGRAHRRHHPPPPAARPGPYGRRPVAGVAGVRPHPRPDRPRRLPSAPPRRR
jgi:hypothetical protein